MGPLRARRQAGRWHTGPLGPHPTAAPATVVDHNDGVAGAGVVTGLFLLLTGEAGIPIPLPTDLVALVLGERAAAGTLPIWLAFLGVEVVAVLGTVALYVACRGPGRAVITRLGPRVGLTEVRLDRVSGLVERRGRWAITAGRATPGLRTLTVVACGSSGVKPRAALPSLALGSSLFLQFHVVLGLVLGAAAREAIDRARGKAVVALIALAVLGAVVWLVRRGRRAGAQSFAEAACPACLAIGLSTASIAGE